MVWYGQTDYDVKLDWGPDGLQALKPYSDVLVIVDILETGAIPTIAASLRNARSAAVKAAGLGKRVSIIASGERWEHSDRLRPGLEDFIGAGAIIANLSGSKSPEAEAAEIVFRSLESDLKNALRDCASGRELIAKGYADDVEISAELDVTKVVPILKSGFYSAL